MLDMISEMINNIEEYEALVAVDAVERNRLQAKYEELLELQERLLAEEG